MDYLVYVTHDAENLQFYLWLQDYTRRFNRLPESEKLLSPEWPVEDKTPDLSGISVGPRSSSKPGRQRGASSPLSTNESKKESSPRSMNKSKKGSFPRSTSEAKDGNFTHIANESKNNNSRDQTRTANMTAFYDDRPESIHTNLLAKETYSTVPATTSPTSDPATQPFRRELDLITAHYLTPSSPRELNLSHRTRTALLRAVHATTHPSALAPAGDLTALTLRNHAHPNFVRWSICNGNRPRVLVLRSFALFWLLAAALLAALLTLSRATRWARVAVAPVLWFGATNLIAASQGLCVLLHRLHEREARPWELLSDEDDGSFGGGDGGGGAGCGAAAGGGKTIPLPATHAHASSPPSLAVSSLRLHGGEPTSFLDLDVEAAPRAQTPSPPSMHSSGEKLAPLGPRNAFEHEAWVARWRARGAWRRIRVPKVRVGERGLRVLQNRIVLQAELWALLLTVPVTAGLVALPAGGFF